MISTKKIIKTEAALKNSVQKLKKAQQNIVVCQGHFNVIHPGHLRFLEYAKKQGDHLLIVLQGFNKIEPLNQDKFFDENERARSVASLEFVDSVFIFNDISFETLIKTIKPKVYVKGEEFAKRIPEIASEIKTVEKYNGKVLFGSGEVHYANTNFLQNDYYNITEQNYNLFKDTLKKQKVNIKKLKNICSSFKKQNILILGDTIVDQYIGCDALGMSSEAPVVVVRELENKEYVGGAAVVSRHVRSLGADCTFISLIGTDPAGSFVKKELEKDKIKPYLIVDKERPTTFKIRYMVGPQKLLRVTRLKEHHLNRKFENLVINKIKKIAKSINGIIISDFVYGMITPYILEKVIKIAQDNNIKIFGDVQSSSQIGNVCKFKDFDLITPTEREARIALDDNYNGLELIGHKLLDTTGSKNVVITLADKGFIAFARNKKTGFTKSQHFPALVTNPLDVVGAGDSLLTGFALSTCAGANIMEAATIAAGIASIAINKIGNIPVKSEEITEWLHSLERN